MSDQIKNLLASLGYSADNCLHGFGTLFYASVCRTRGSQKIIITRIGSGEPKLELILNSNGPSFEQIELEKYMLVLKAADSVTIYNLKDGHFTKSSYQANGVIGDV